MPSKIVARLHDKTFVNVFSQGNQGVESVKNSYNLPDLTDEQHVPFDPERKLEDDEWFFIQPNADERAEIIQPYMDTIARIDLINPIERNDYPNIRAICFVEQLEDNFNLILTKIYPRFYTITKKYLKWEDGPALITHSNSVDFSGKVDAFWRDNRLFFKSYTSIKSVFSGPENFYRMATEEEKESFLGKSFFECQDRTISIRSRNLRKIASILNEIAWDDVQVRASYIAYANQYPDLGIEITAENKMLIQSNADLTKILNVLQERLYTTPITGQPREANSVSPIQPI